MRNTPPTIADTPSPRPGSVSLPNPALIGIGALLLTIGLAAVLFWNGNAAVFRYAIPYTALGVGFLLYRTAPVLYIGFAWWLWFLAPFLRRIVDYQAGWQDPNFIMLAPYLVSGICILTVIRHRHQLLHRDYFPFAVIMAGILYGYLIGILRGGLATATYDLLRWLIPLLFGLHIALLWREYAVFRHCIQRTFLWGVVLLGLYGVVQFYVLPPWDAFWMVNSGMHSIGQPRPFAVRVFSTMNFSGPYATMMTAGVLLLFTLRPWKHLMAAVPGYAGFLLSLVRSSWGSWVIALSLMVFWIKGRMRMRMLGILAVGALVLLPALTVPEIKNRLDYRFSTFENLGEDNSFNARMTLYRKATLRAMTNPVGTGIGTAGAAQKMKSDVAPIFDSGLLVITLQLGWPGLLSYLGGLLMLVLLLWKIPRRTNDPFIIISVAIAFAMVALLPFKNALVGATAPPFWCFAGLAIAGLRYNRTREEEEWAYDEAAIDEASEER